MSSKYDINIHKLHEEWQKQPLLYHEAAGKLADATESVDRLKGKLELVAAQVEMDARDNPSKYRLKKVTDESVKKAVITSQEYQKALSIYHNAKSEAAHLRAEVDYLDHRKTAIEYLTKLRLADYFADPRISHDAREAQADEKIKRTAHKGSR